MGKRLEITNNTSHIRSGLESLKSAIEIMANSGDAIDDSPQSVINLCQQLKPTGKCFSEFTLCIHSNSFIFS